MGETRVDLLHLLEDLADAYPGDLDETVLTEMIANTLDSHASTIDLRTDPAASTLTVIDDGQGMSRAELRRFHDVAATAKPRGEGIGFAGVGIKLGLLVSEEVLTETSRGKNHVATTWRLASRHRALWHWTTPPGLVGERGTAVRLRLHNALSPLLESGFLETAIRHHFKPLLDPFFDELLREHYPRGVRFQLNGRELSRHRRGAPVLAPIALHVGRKRKPSAVGYLSRASEDGVIAEDKRGIAISTFGKVIKRGWDWLGVSPAAPERVTGLIEAPALASCLTLNKVDFIRSGARGATYLAFRKALQEAVSNQLAAWGDQRESEERGRRRAVRPVERDLEAVLLDLADRFPLLATLVGRRPGGQRKLRVGLNGAEPHVNPIDLFAADAPPRVDESEAEEEGPLSERSDASPATDVGRVDPPQASARMGLPGRTATRRPIRLGLSIHFESRPGQLDLARLVETTVWVNDLHPAYRRAASSRSEGYHLALSVAMALAGVAVEPDQAHAFVAEFLARWGESTERHTRMSTGGQKRALD